jgi:hypothetical protein
VSLGLADDRKLTSLSLIRAASVTHSYNTDQRRVALSFEQNGRTVSARMPAGGNQLPPGSYLLSGVDSKGVPTPAQMVTIKRSGAGTVTVYDADRTAEDRTGPATRVRFPQTDGYLRPGDSIRVEASDPNGVTDVELWVNGKLADTAPAGGPLRWSPAAPEGRATMIVRAYDTIGNVTEKTRQVLVDNKPPGVTVTPATGAHVRTATITAGVTGIRDASGLSRLQVQIGNGPVTTVTAAPWTARLAAGTLSNGRHTITFRALDRAGNLTTVRQPLNFDTTKPSLRLTSAPRHNAKLRKTVTIKAAAADNLGVDRVELLVNGKVVATDKKAAYQLKLNPKKYGKKFTVRLRAYDRAGNVVNSEQRTYRR